MNPYITHPEKIEFVITYACTGRCRHCSEGEHTPCGEQIDAQVAANAVRELARHYPIKTLMTFGGEPLLYPETVFAIQRAGRECGIPRRQIITNGCFSWDRERISAVCEGLAECGVNDILLSVDAFHQETLPLETVKIFAAEAKKCAIPIRLQPAWLVSPTDENPYNLITREILDGFSDLDIPVSEGNVIFAEGNAQKYLAAYFTASAPENPYREDPCVVKCISFAPNGDVLGGNVYRCGIMEIIRDYAP